MENTSYLETEVITLWKFENLIIGKYLESVKTVDYTVAKKVVDFRLGFIDPIETLPMLIDMTNVDTVDKGARRYLAEAEASQGVEIAGLLLKSKLQEIITNFYLRIEKPSVETKFFNNSTLAINWLHKNSTKLNLEIKKYKDFIKKTNLGV